MERFDAVSLLRKVRDGKPVAPEHLQAFIAGLVSGEVTDYQASAFTMAVYCRGLSDELTVALTEAMRDSGDVVDMSHVSGMKVDKHSTGGVGDKISLPLAPAVAACGVLVPMISGRGLGHSGGTLDKLESIPGFRVDLSVDAFRKQVAELGLCLIGQTADIAPADKKLYALRDVTGTVESIPLITSSILSKKLAEGINALVLDVKVGCGAFMKDLDSARELATALVSVGQGAGLKVRALLTRMEAPLGRTIGNALEVREAIEILRGEGPDDTTMLTVELGAEMLMLAGKVRELSSGRHRIREVIESGAALQKFAACIEAQSGDPKVVQDPGRLPQAKHKIEVRAARDGIVQSIDSFALGVFAIDLGAGRKKTSDQIDPSTGLEILVHPDDKVAANDVIAVVHASHDDVNVDGVRDAFVIGDDVPAAIPLILDRV